MVLDILWSRTWWRYRPGDPSDFSAPLHFFNLFEGTVWVVFSVLVLVRRRRSGRSTIELWYALAFFTFGLTESCWPG